MVYIGPFEKGLPSGKGKWEFSNGAKMSGIFGPDGAPPTEGKFTYPDGRVYRGLLIPGLGLPANA
jgi:hypothetical protein